ncbi:MAG: hypothetical protein DYH06_01940 [Acidobacteria bacterium ACB2]|nr:hypothetical protein [Acidobacteria bacterium ACB2]
MRPIPAIPLLLLALAAPRALAARVFLPGAAQVDGGSGARFRSEVVLSNPGTTAADVTVTLIPGGATPSAAPAVLLLPAGRTARFPEALRDLFGVESGFGTLAVSSPVPVLASLTTRNVADPRGTYGVSVPAVAEPSLLGAGETGHAVWLTHSAGPDAGFRTNVSVTLVDPGSSVEVRVLDSSGRLAGSRVVSGGPLTWQESAGTIAGPLPIGRAEVRVTAGRATGYTVVNDNVTSDAIATPFERVRPGPSELLLDGVARTAGQNDTHWSTDLRLYNPGATPLAVVLSGLGLPSAPAPLSVIVPADSVVEVPDVLGESGLGLPDGVAGALRLSAAGPLLVAARTSNTDPAGERPGTFSAQQRAIPWPSGLLAAPSTAAFAGVDHVTGATGFRSNLAFLGGPNGAAGTLHLFDASGSESASAPLVLLANEWHQESLSGWFGGAPVPAGGRVEVAVSSGSLDAYLSRIDNGTGDAVVQSPVSISSSAPGFLPSFPGAEGFGAVATGGRGGRVVAVTNLNAGGPGSLQDALDQEGPRTVVFRVSGVVDAAVHLTRGDVTIAGQTSPGGITVRQLHTTEEPFCDQDPSCILDPATLHAENWVVRHLRMRPAGGGYDDGLRVRHTRRAVVDHCSIGNAEDEAVEVSLSNDVTIQATLLAETVGDHANLGGMLMNYSNPAAGFGLDRVSVHHSCWNRILGRMPELSRESPAAAGSTTRIELTNNLLWDPGFYVDVNATTVSGSTEGSPVFYELNWVGNFAFLRPDHPYGLMGLALNTPNLTTTYFSDNRTNLYSSRADYQLLYCCNDYPATVADPSLLPYPDPASPPPFARSERHPFPPVTITPSASLVDWMRRNVGAFPRDPMDTRLLAPLSTGVLDPAPRDANPYGDALLTAFPAGAPPAPPADTDGDGMPDDWETAHGLDPLLADPNGTSLSLPFLGVAGYTDLEVSLSWLSDRLVSGGPAGPSFPPDAPPESRTER